jgi:hypothetical protein
MLAKGRNVNRGVQQIARDQSRAGQDQGLFKIALTEHTWRFPQQIYSHHLRGGRLGRDLLLYIACP